VLKTAVTHLQAYVDTPRGNQDVGAVTKLGDALVEQGQRLKDVDLTQAIESFSRAYALDKTNEPALEGRAWSHHDRAVKMREGSIPASANLQPDDDLREAVADFSLALQISLDAQRAYDAQKNKPLAADEVDAMKLVKERAARLPELYIGRGRAYLGQGRYDEAIADFTEAVKIAPSSVEGYQWRGFAQGKKAVANNNDKQLFTAAYSDFGQALANAGDSPEGHQRAEVLLYRAQTRRDDPTPNMTYKTAMSDLDDAKKIAPSRADLHYEASLTALQIVQALDTTKASYSSCRSSKAKDYCQQDPAQLDTTRKGLKETAKNESQQARDLEPANKKYNDQFSVATAASGI